MQIPYVLSSFLPVPRLVQHPDRLRRLMPEHPVPVLVLNGTAGMLRHLRRARLIIKSRQRPDVSILGIANALLIYLFTYNESYQH